MDYLLFLNLGAPEILIIGVVILLVFGGKKIPELMHSLGKGVKNFKEGMNSMEDDFKKGLNEDGSTATTSNDKPKESAQSEQNI